LDDGLEAIETIDRLEATSREADNWLDREELLREVRMVSKVAQSLLAKARAIEFKCMVEPAGENPFGEASSGILQILGHTKPAILKYVYIRSGSGEFSTSVRDPLQHQLTIPQPDIGSVELSFLADSVLSQPPHELPEGAALYVLLVHPFICLVLRKREANYTYERVGIIRQPRGLHLLYGLDWMGDSKLSEMIIT
jgi:hypothetical protein